MVEPARFALTSTPSIGPSSAELTMPLSASARCAWAAGRKATNETSNAARVRMAPPLARRLLERLRLAHLIGRGFEAHREHLAGFAIDHHFGEIARQRQGELEGPHHAPAGRLFQAAGN